MPEPRSSGRFSNQSSQKQIQELLDCDQRSLRQHQLVGTYIRSGALRSNVTVNVICNTCGNAVINQSVIRDPGLKVVSVGGQIGVSGFVQNLIPAPSSQFDIVRTVSNTSVPEEGIIVRVNLGLVTGILRGTTDHCLRGIAKEN